MYILVCRASSLRKNRLMLRILSRKKSCFSTSHKYSCARYDLATLGRKQGCLLQKKYHDINDLIR